LSSLISCRNGRDLMIHSNVKIYTLEDVYGTELVGYNMRPCRDCFNKYRATLTSCLISQCVDSYYALLQIIVIQSNELCSARPNQLDRKNDKCLG
jgi:hypothetical protein